MLCRSHAHKAYPLGLQTQIYYTYKCHTADEKILQIKKYPKAFHIIHRTYWAGKPHQNFKALNREKNLTAARKKKK